MSYCVPCFPVLCLVQLHGHCFVCLNPVRSTRPTYLKRRVILWSLSLGPLFGSLTNTQHHAYKPSTKLRTILPISFQKVRAGTRVPCTLGSRTSETKLSWSLPPASAPVVLGDGSERQLPLKMTRPGGMMTAFWLAG